MALYFDVGTPKEFITVIKGQNLTLTPKIVDISATNGSIEDTRVVDAQPEQ